MTEVIDLKVVKHWIHLVTGEILVGDIVFKRSIDGNSRYALPDDVYIVQDPMVHEGNKPLKYTKEPRRYIMDAFTKEIPISKAAIVTMYPYIDGWK